MTFPSLIGDVAGHLRAEWVRSTKGREAAHLVTAHGAFVCGMVFPRYAANFVPCESPPFGQVCAHCQDKAGRYDVRPCGEARR